MADTWTIILAFLTVGVGIGLGLLFCHIMFGWAKKLHKENKHGTDN